MSEVAIEEYTVPLPARDSIIPYARRWTATSKPRGLVVVGHGMGEHSARYLAPLEPVIRDGFDVYAIDHRGHGRTAQEGKLGDYGEGGFDGLITDLAGLVRTARRDHPGIPVVLLGHSMGSMIAQAFVIDHAELLDGLVLSGSVAVDHIPTGGDPEMLIPVLNSPFAPARTPFDWLSRDEEEVDRYMADPHCGFGLSDDSFASLSAQGPRLADPASLANIPDALPIYIFSGDRDPLHCVLNGLQPLVDRYRQAGKTVASRIYPDGRHEMLNETNRDEVVSDLLAWLHEIA